MSRRAARGCAGRSLSSATDARISRHVRRAGSPAADERLRLHARGLAGVRLRAARRVVGVVVAAVGVGGRRRGRRRASPARNRGRARPSRRSPTTLSPGDELADAEVRGDELRLPLRAASRSAPRSRVVAAGRRRPAGRAGRKPCGRERIERRRGQRRSTPDPFSTFTVTSPGVTPFGTSASASFVGRERTQRLQHGAALACRRRASRCHR